MRAWPLALTFFFSSCSLPTSPQVGSLSCAGALSPAEHWCLTGDVEPSWPERSDAVWHRVSECLGVREDLPHGFPIRIVPGDTLDRDGNHAFWCGQTLVAACFGGTEIVIGRDYFDDLDALPHEMIRFGALYGLNRPYLDLKDPLFGRCQR